MNEHGIEDVITKLYEMIQDARGVPLSADKCIVERDRVLDLLDEISVAGDKLLASFLIGNIRDIVGSEVDNYVIGNEGAEIPGCGLIEESGA